MSLENDFNWSPETVDGEFERALSSAKLDEPATFEVEALPPTPAPQIIIHYRMRSSSLLFLVGSILILGTAFFLNYARPRMPWETVLVANSTSTAKLETQRVPTLNPFRFERFEQESGLPGDPDLRSIARSFAEGGQDFALSFHLPQIGPVPHIGALGNSPPMVEIAPGGRNEKVIDNGPIDPAEVWNDINREAEARNHRQEEQLRQKADRPAQARREVSNQIADFKRQADANRPAFRQALRGVLDRSGPKAGMEARRLSEAMHIEVPQDLLSKANYLKENSAARLGRTDQLDLFRAIGLPETSLLNHLAELETKKASIRGGPRTLDEAWLRASRVLLDSPPGPKSQTMPAMAKLYFTPNGPGRNASRTSR